MIGKAMGRTEHLAWPGGRQPSRRILLRLRGGGRNGS